MRPDERAQWIVRSAIDYMTDRMTAMKEQEGNPMGADILQLGEAVAYYSRNMPWPMFNHVKGELAPGDVDDAIDFYELRGRKAEFHIAPGISQAETLRRLAERGFYQSGFHVMMYADEWQEEDYPDNNSGIEVRPLEADELLTYADIHCLGTGLSLDGKQHVADNNRLLYTRAGWFYFLGLAEGKPASVGVLFVKDGIAHYTFAATVPEERNKGLHSALLRARLLLARDLGCKLVAAECAYGSASHRNMERAGMKIGMTRATWSKL